MSPHTFAALVAAGVGLLLILALRWAVRQLQDLDAHLDELDGISPLDRAAAQAKELDQ
ncbi:MAG: hypothetical protein RJA98_3828 [Pseudomonadota bacterium]|jgi:hypothetical protein